MAKASKKVKIVGGSDLGTKMKGASKKGGGMKVNKGGFKK